MHFDRLDEIYAMVKSNWQFEKVFLTGLTGVHDWSDRFAQFVQQTLTYANFGWQQLLSTLLMKNVLRYGREKIYLHSMYEEASTIFL